MAHTTTPPSVNTSIAPAQLWVGSDAHLVEQALLYLQRILCPQQGCHVCTTCNRIRQHQHQSVVWFTPEKNYTVEQLAPIHEIIALGLDTHQRCFFVLQKADLLPPACANRLLKAMEEPPAGYHFLLLAERREAILPTIRSRCTLKTFQPSSTTQLHASLRAFFTDGIERNPLIFIKELDAADITEHESLELLDDIFEFWMLHYRQRVMNHHSTAREEKIIGTFLRAFEIPPMPGSSKLFWKNLFLQIND